MKEKLGIKIEVQRIVESPHIYILVRCSNSIADQLAYSETRMEDIRQLSSSGVVSRQETEIKDKAKFSMAIIPQPTKSGQEIIDYY